jgi:two-component system, chemotaxis family, chemotaxis protein CheY
MKALIIDDTKAMRTFMRYLTQELQITSVEAVDGLDALEVLKKNPDCDIALVDWDMPRMNGLEFVQAIRADRTYDNLKLMMVTTQNAMERVAEALDAGANDYLMKPVTKEALEEKLRVLGFLV